MPAPPRPLDPRPFVGFTVTIPDNLTVVELVPGPFNNTKEILFKNLSTGRVFIQVVDAGNPPVLPLIAAVTLANSTVLPGGEGLGLCICSEGGRVSIGDTAWWAANGPGSQFIIVLAAEDVAGAMVNVTYLQNVGGADGRGCGGC